LQAALEHRLRYPISYREESSPSACSIASCIAYPPSFIKKALFAVAFSNVLDGSYWLMLRSYKKAKAKSIWKAFFSSYPDAFRQ